VQAAERIARLYTQYWGYSITRPIVETLRIGSTVGKVGASAGLLLACVLALAVGTSSARAATTMTFTEPHRSETGRYVDLPPKLKASHRITAGDELVFTDVLEQSGRRVGRLRSVCTATRDATRRHPVATEFLCNVAMKIPGGTLEIVVPYDSGPAEAAGIEGAVVGGTGTYVGARGSYAVRKGRLADTSTVTLLE
jgi:hypothetical protein